MRALFHGPYSFSLGLSHVRAACVVNSDLDIDDQAINGGRYGVKITMNEALVNACRMCWEDIVNTS